MSVLNSFLPLYNTVLLYQTQEFLYYVASNRAPKLKYGSSLQYVFNSKYQIILVVKASLLLNIYCQAVNFKERAISCSIEFNLGDQLESSGNGKCKSFTGYFQFGIILKSIIIKISRARLQRAAGELDAVHHVWFLYICRALGHLSQRTTW